MYVFMGAWANSVHLKDVDSFNPATGLWSPLADSPLGERSDGACFASEGDAYYVAGDDGDGPYDNVGRYRPTTNTWKSRADFPKTSDELANNSFAINA